VDLILCSDVCRGQAPAAELNDLRIEVRQGEKTLGLHVNDPAKEDVDEQGCVVDGNLTDTSVGHAPFDALRFDFDELLHETAEMSVKVFIPLIE
jgi:hypothetical protein